MKRVLVLGIKGMAGHLIYNYFNLLNNYEVFGVARNLKHQKNIYNLDITNIKELEQIIINNNFNVVINCIGILNKDAEDNPEKAIWYNSYFPHLLESITKNTTTKFIHISTDCVFSGKRGKYTEYDFKDGTGFYAQSKALGEVVNNKDTTIRTSIIGPELNSTGIGLLNWFLNQSKDSTLNGFSNVFWTGLTTLELAKSIEEIIKQNITGLIQVVPETKISKHKLILNFNKIYRDNKLTILEDSKFKVDKSLVSIREDFNYKVPNYLEMLQEQKKWMLKHNALYTHYNL